jgi:uncharacterized protein YecE (DUF72 family)
MAGRTIIGTSGWHYNHWIGNFYPEGLRKDDWLDHYLKFFRSVEVNNSFYHLPKPTTFQNWRKSTPPDFVFAVKASRYITHMKKLKDPKPALKEFLNSAKNLGPKLGPILFQLPPGWNKNTERLEGILKIFPRKFRCAWEFRNETWFSDDVLEILRRYNAGFCIYQIKGLISPHSVTADFVYLRMHGPSEFAYQGDYSLENLRGWAREIRKWNKEGRDVYVYFDNDQAGYAAKNAIELKRILKA